VPARRLATFGRKRSVNENCRKPPLDKGNSGVFAAQKLIAPKPTYTAVALADQKGGHLREQFDWFRALTFDIAGLRGRFVQFA
jgi:hypothetical protein